MSDRRDFKLSVTANVVAGVILLILTTVVALVIKDAQSNGKSTDASTQPPSNADLTSLSSATNLSSAGIQPLIASSVTTTLAPPSVAAPVFANVADLRLPSLCSYSDCSGTQQVGSSVFAYTENVPANYYPDYRPTQAIGTAGTTCKSITIQFSGDEWMEEGSQSTTVAYLKFIQQSAAPVYAQVTPGKVETVQVPLDGGSLYVDAAVQSRGGIHNNVVLLKVAGLCSTPDGVR